MQWNWLTSATYTKDNTSGISVAVDDANPPIVQVSTSDAAR